MSGIMQGLARQVAMAVFRKPHLTVPCWATRCPTFQTSLTQNYSVFGPDDVGLEPEVKEYDTLHIKMKGYDFVVLESYAKYINNLAQSFDLQTQSFAAPCRTSYITTFKPQSILVDTEYDLALYERVIEITDVPCTTLPLLLEVAQLQLPSGVQFTVQQPNPDDEEWRYVPDRELRDVQAQLDEMDRLKEEKKKK